MKPFVATDRELLHAYLHERDEVAFTALWRRHQAMVTAVARRIVGHLADAEDVTQEVFSELSRSAAEIESPAAWLHRAATFRAIDRLRTVSGKQRRLSHLTEPSYVMRTPDWGVDAQVDQALETLDELDRRLIVLHFLEGRSQKEVADEVGLDQASVSRRVSSARERLRRVLASMGLGGGSVPALAWLEAGPVPRGTGSGASASTTSSATAFGKTVVASGVGVGLGVAGLVWATSVGPAVAQPPVAGGSIPVVAAPALLETAPEGIRSPAPAVGRMVQMGDQLLPDDVRGVAQQADGSLVIGQLQREPGAGLIRCRDGRLLPPLALPSERCANHGLVADADGLWAILAQRLGPWSTNATWQRELWQLQPVQRRLAVLDQVRGEVATPAGGLGKVGSRLVAAVGDQLVACGPDGEEWRRSCRGAREVAHDRLRRADGSLWRIGARGDLEPLPGRYDFIAPAPGDRLLSIRGETLQEVANDGTITSQATTAEKGVTGLLRLGDDWLVAANGVGTAGIGGLGAVVASPGKWALRSVGWIDGAAVTADGRVLSTGQRWRSDGTFDRWTIDGLAHPEDPRLFGFGSAAWQASVSGHELLLAGHDFGNAVLYRFAADGIAIPVAAWMTAAADERPRSAIAGWPAAYAGTGSWSWYDSDGDGRMQPAEFRADAQRGYQGSCWLDARGGVWRNLRQADGISYSGIERMLPDGRPVFAAVRRFAVPAPLRAVERLAYDAEADALYATGFTDARPAIGDDGRWGGSELVRVDGWLHGARTLRWRVAIPYAVGSAAAASGLTIAPGAVFVGSQRISEVLAFAAETGQTWGTLPRFDDRPGVATGWNWGGLRALVLAPRSYLVTAADRGGWVSWRWSPPD